jgi:hypothetical protein
MQRSIGQADHGSADRDGSVEQVEVSSSKAEDLLTPQGAEGGEQDSRPEPRCDGVGQGVDLGNGGYGTLRRRSAPAPFTWHGFFTIRPSVTAVFKIVRSSR